MITLFDLIKEWLALRPQFKLVDGSMHRWHHNGRTIHGFILNTYKGQWVADIFETHVEAKPGIFSRDLKVILASDPNFFEKFEACLMKNS